MIISKHIQGAVQCAYWNFHHRFGTKALFLFLLKDKIL